MVNKAKHYIQIIESQLELTSSFVNDLLDLSQIEAGVFTLVDNLFNPNETFSHLFNIFVKQAESKGICLSWAVIDGPMEVFATERSEGG